MSISVAKIAGLAGIINPLATKTANQSDWSIVGASNYGLGGYSLTSNATTGDSATYATSWVTRTKCYGVRWMFNNSYKNASGANSINVKMGFSVDGGVTWIPVFFSGKNTGTIDPGGTLYTDPVGVIVPVGTTVQVHTYVGGAAGATWPNDAINVLASFGADYSMATIPGSTFSVGYGPQRMEGLTQPRRAVAPNILVQGDSIVYGAGDGSVGGVGWCYRALAASIGFARIGAYSIRGDQILSEPAHHSAAQLQGIDTLISAFGSNDINGNQAWTAVAATMQSMWSQAAANGVRKIYQTTITTRTTSSDSWATKANQAPVVTTSGLTAWGKNGVVYGALTGTGACVALNAWIRGGAPQDGSGNPVAPGTAGSVSSPLLTGYIDLAATVADPTDEVYWLTNGTANYTVSSDGIHPSAGGHTLMAGAVPTSSLIIPF